MEFENSEWNPYSHAIPSLDLTFSQLHEASYSRKPDVLLALLEPLSPLQKAEALRSRDPVTGNTPLLWAAMSGCSLSVSLLLRTDSNNSNFSQNTAWKVRNQEKKTILHLAVASGSPECVSVCLAHPFIPALLSSPDENGATPLHYAAIASCCTTEIVAKMGDFRVVDEDGESPLHWACREGCLETIKLILFSEWKRFGFNSRPETAFNTQKGNELREGVGGGGEGCDKAVTNPGNGRGQARGRSERSDDGPLLFQKSHDEETPLNILLSYRPKDVELLVNWIKRIGPSGFYDQGRMRTRCQCEGEEF